MTINKLFAEAEKILPFRKAMPFLLSLLFIGVVFVISITMHSKTQNRKFFGTELNGVVNEIEYKSKGNYFQIGTKWYLIKHEVVALISEGDSINKSENSNTLTIYDKQAKIKWQKEVNGLIFKEVDVPN